MTVSRPPTSIVPRSPTARTITMVSSMTRLPSCERRCVRHTPTPQTFYTRTRLLHIGKRLGTSPRKRARRRVRRRVGVVPVPQRASLAPHHREVSEHTSDCTRDRTVACAPWCIGEKQWRRECLPEAVRELVVSAQERRKAPTVCARQPSGPRNGPLGGSRC